MSQENVEIVRRFFEAFASTEFERLREALSTSSSFSEAVDRVDGLAFMADVLDPQVELDFSSMPAFPEGNRFQGHDGWFELWRSWLTPWESFEYSTSDWHAVGDQVLVQIEQRGRVGDGPELSAVLHNLWTFKGKKVIRLQFFSTREEALEAAGLSE